MNYFEIGQRIRKYRKARDISQEELAEMAGISVTHMSHIETGNTKLSLPVLVCISESLDVTTDSLLFGDREHQKNAVANALYEMVNCCSPAKAKVLLDIMQSVVQSLDRYIDTGERHE